MPNINSADLNPREIPVIPVLPEPTPDLNRTSEFIEQTSASDFSLIKAEFDLKREVTLQELKHKNVEFYILLLGKGIVVLLAMAIVICTAYQLHDLITLKSIDKNIYANPPALLAVVVGSFGIIFGLLTVLVKGLNPKETQKTEPLPLALTEIAKAILTAFKSGK